MSKCGPSHRASEWQSCQGVIPWHVSVPWKRWGLLGERRGLGATYNKELSCSGNPGVPMPIPVILSIFSRLLRTPPTPWAPVPHTQMCPNQRSMLLEYTPFWVTPWLVLSSLRCRSLLSSQSRENAKRLTASIHPPANPLVQIQPQACQSKCKIDPPFATKIKTQSN